MYCPALARPVNPGPKCGPMSMQGGGAKDGVMVLSSLSQCQRYRLFCHRAAGTVEALSRRHFKSRSAGRKHSRSSRTLGTCCDAGCLRRHACHAKQAALCAAAAHAALHMRTRALPGPLVCTLQHGVTATQAAVCQPNHLVVPPSARTTRAPVQLLLHACRPPRVSVLQQKPLPSFTAPSWMTCKGEVPCRGWPLTRCGACTARHLNQ